MGNSMAQVAPSQQVTVVAAGAAIPYGQLLEPHYEFKIAQTRKGCLQELLGCEANSQFNFIINGAHVGMIDEETSCMMRFCCGNDRPWTTKLRASGASSEGPVVLSYVRPFRCKTDNCKCCC